MGARRRLGLVVAMGVIKLFTRAGGSQALTYVSFLRFAFPPSLCFAFSAKQHLRHTSLTMCSRTKLSATEVGVATLSLVLAGQLLSLSIVS